LSSATGAGATTTTASAAESGVASGIVQNPSFFDEEARSTKISFLSPATLLADNPTEYSIIIRAQCYFHTPDPIFLVPDQTTQTRWMFAGRLDKKHDFNAVEYRSLLTLGLVPGVVQLSPWPVQLATLSDMPDMFLKERLPMLAKAHLDSTDQRELEETYLQQEHHIEGVIGHFEHTFNPKAMCKP
jgi:hypothetical protein